MARELRVILCGLGPIGQGIARLALEATGLRVVGATDISPTHAGKDLGVVLGLPKKVRVKVEADPARLLRKTKADVAILCTGSTVKAVKPQVLALLKKGLHVVTTCEEMAFPAPAHLTAIKEVDRLARAKKVSVLGTGVNRVSVTRIVNAATRRLPLQRKVGVGLNLAQFRRALTEGSVRHVGLVESVHMIAAGLGWKLDKVDESIEPAIAPRDLDTDYLRVPAGAVAGIKQAARGYRNGDLAVSLDLQMYVGAESPRDHVLVDGDPRIDVTVAGGFAGDVATGALVVNSIPKLMAAPAGFVTMKDLPLVHCWNPSEVKALPPKKR